MVETLQEEQNKRLCCVCNSAVFFMLHSLCSWHLLERRRVLMCAYDSSSLLKAACSFGTQHFYESVWLAKKALVFPQVGLVHRGQRRVSWREQGWLDLRWDWTKSARAWIGEREIFFFFSSANWLCFCLLDKKGPISLVFIGFITFFIQVITKIVLLFTTDSYCLLVTDFQPHQ